MSQRFLFSAAILLMAAPTIAFADFPELVYQRWSGSINVPDPVAISIADNGDVFVTQTQRRKIQDLDIRAHREWIPDDVGLASVDDKRDFLHRMLAIDGDQEVQAKQVEDVNEDGRHDWRDLTVISERIHRLVDHDGDGTSDEISLFAEGFQTEVTGIAAGVLAYEDSVWATIAPDVWKLTDTDGDGVADRRKVVASGFGLHIAYAGHDMHGLTVGPDGKVYWSIGDKGIHVTTTDGNSFHFPNQGGVLRCNPDGSDFEVFAHGLRNVQEVAFDQFGNLFGVDNDADQPNEKERFVWIVDGMDAGWRCNYQYRGDGYNPWTEEKLWELAGDKHAAYLVPPIQHYHDGPAGFKFNPGTALSTAYRNFFFLTSAPNGYQYAFRVEPSGDSYAMKDSHLIGSGDPIVGLAFGPDGGLYGVDWGGGYPLNQKGSVIRIDAPELSESERADRSDTTSLLAGDFDPLAVDQLKAYLAHADQRIRLKAQFALVKRRHSESLRGVLADTSSNPLARLHSIWGLGQLARARVVPTEVLINSLDDPDWHVRAQAAKTWGETNQADAECLLPLLEDAQLHVRVHAALAIARCSAAPIIDLLVDQVAGLSTDQHYLRHALVGALAKHASPEELAELVSDDREMVRLAGVLALRRKADGAVGVFLSDPSVWVATEAARAIHDDLSIEQAMGELASALTDPRTLPDAFVVRAINANFRLGTPESAARVMSFAADADRPTSQRVVACQALAQWLDPPALDRVDGRRRAFGASRQLDMQSMSQLVASLVASSPTSLRVAAVQAARSLEIKLERESLLAIVRDTESPDDLRVESLQALADRIELDLLVRLTEDPAVAVAVRSVEVMTRLFPAALDEHAERLLASAHIPVRQACVGGFGRLATDDEGLDERLAERLNSLGELFVSGELDSRLQLDVLVAVQSRNKTGAFDQVLRRMHQIRELSAVDDPKLKPFQLCVDGGDAARGEAIFRNDLRAQCIRCHRIGKKGSNIGPELTRIAKQRDPGHLLRAIVSPSADIEPKYNAQTLLLSDGSVLRGVITKEDDENTMLVNDKGKQVTIASDDIEEIAESKISLMPEMTGVLQPNEVRDLVAYLKTLR